MEILLEFMGKGFVTMLMISMPCVLTAAAIGLVVGILQAVTQVQEQTIAAAPKILAVFLVIIIFGVGFLRILTNLMQEASSIAFNIIPKNETYVLAANYHKYTKPFAGEMNQDAIDKDSNMTQLLKNPDKKVPFTGKDERLRYNSASKQPNPTPNFIERKKIMGR